jgi:hypothetical protein
VTWTHLDDGFTDRPIFEDLSYEARWHYLAGQAADIAQADALDVLRATLRGDAR